MHIIPSKSLFDPHLAHFLEAYIHTRPLGCFPANCVCTRRKVGVMRHVKLLPRLPICMIVRVHVCIGTHANVAVFTYVFMYTHCGNWRPLNVKRNHFWGFWSSEPVLPRRFSTWFQKKKNQAVTNALTDVKNSRNGSMYVCMCTHVRIQEEHSWSQRMYV
jgi:hypothetical protein